MPPLDPTIPLRAISGRRNSLVDEYAAAVGIKNAFAQQKALEADLARQESVRNAFAGAVDPATGEMDWHRASNALAPIDPQAAIGLRKDLAEERAAETSHRLDQLELHSKAFERAAQMLQSAQTQADWDAGIMWGEQFLGPELMRGVPRVFSEQARQAVLQSVLSVKDQLDMALDQRRFDADDAYRNAQLGETRRHNIASEANAARVSPPSGYRWTAGGGLEAIPGGPATAPKDPPSGYRWAPDGALEPIAGGPADPKNKSNMNLTESQGKAVSFAKRAIESDRIINGLDREGTHGYLAGAAEQARDIPLVGGVVGPAANWAVGKASPASQKYGNAKKNFITAILRRESGAAIQDFEYAREEAKYFPQVGDTPETIQQKARMRKESIDGLIAEAGPAQDMLRSQLGPSDATMKRPEEMTNEELLQAIYARGR